MSKMKIDVEKSSYCVDYWQKSKYKEKKIMLVRTHLCALKIFINALHTPRKRIKLQIYTYGKRKEIGKNI